MAEKSKDEFRNYSNSCRQSVVENHYRMMRQNQCLSFVRNMHSKYDFSKEPRALMSIRTAFAKLETYVDSSDPDTQLPNFIHSIQTAESIKADGKPDWFQLVGLLHDMGKIMFLWGDKETGQIGKSDGPQWALGGDTWAVGCKIPDTVVFPEYNALNPDYHNPILNTKYGIYKEKCGIDNMLFTYGHDEYMYQMLVANKCTLPSEAMAMIRYHSAYPWHTGKSYESFMIDTDYDKMNSALEFNKYDLYTKNDDDITKQLTLDDVELLWPYYQTLINKYLPLDSTIGLRW